MAPSEVPPAAEILFAARTDVTVEPQGDKLVIHDPRKNSFAQLGTAEYIVLRCFDGRSTAQDIVDRLKRERGVIVSREQVLRLRDRLHEKQLVLAPGEVVKTEHAKVTDGSGLVARLVMIELPLAWNPDVFLTRVYHRIKYVVFRPAFFVALGALTAVAAAVWVRSFDRILLQATELDPKRSFLLYYLCFSATFFLHECAHGVACKGFGGKVPRIGAFLYYFFTVFYTDVSSSWMFRSKLHRLMVLFAGAISNIALCGLATLLWRITPQGSPVNQVCFALMTINAAAASYTLFPLLRGDGYYILSTALDVPNLRQNARSYVRARLRRAFLDRGAAVPRATDREALVYLCYAPLQLVFVVCFFGYVLVQGGLWLLGELELLGFLILAIALLNYLRRPLLRLAGGALALAAAALRLGLDEGPRPLLALLARPLCRGARWIARAWRLELLIAIPIVLLSVIPYRLHISAPFEVMSAGPVTVRTQMSGIVERYAVSAGARVRAGEVVAVLADDELRLERQIAAAALAEERARLAALEAGARAEDLARARSELAAHRQATALAALELGRARDLFARQIASPKELDAAIAAHESAAARERQAEAALALLAAGHTAEERERQRARVERAERAIALIDQRLAWTQIRAAADGIVVTRARELEQRVGARVEPGDAVIEIVAPAELVARLAVPERLAGEVAVAMPVALRFFQDPGVARQARVDAIEPAVTGAGPGAAAGGGAAAGAVGALARFGDLGGALPLGATGIAKIDAGSHSLLGLLLRRAHRSLWVTFWSWW